MHEFNKEAVLEQRESREGSNNLLYWTNKKIKQWLNQIDLQVKQISMCLSVYVQLYETCMHA